MFCPKCGNDAGNAQFCPKCGSSVLEASSPKSKASKPKKKFYKKWWFWVIIVIVVISIGSSVGKDSSTSSNNTSDTATQESSTKAPEKTTKAISYNKYNVTELFDDLKNNAMKAQSKHKDEYVEVTGYLYSIDASGKYISINAGENNYDYLLDNMQLYIKDDSQKEKIMNLSTGNKMTIKCHITTVGELMGYQADIIEIL